LLRPPGLFLLARPELDAITTFRQFAHVQLWIWDANFGGNALDLLNRLGIQENPGARIVERPQGTRGVEERLGARNGLGNIDVNRGGVEFGRRRLL
jgi:hypothetical protein